MSDAHFTEADVRYLLRAKKFIHSVIKDTMESQEAALLEIIYRIARVDNPSDEIKLRLSARRPKPPAETLPRLRPSVALQWHGKRIRGIDRKVVHPVIKNGLIVGRVRGWHEHRWTSTDEDNSVIDVNEVMKNVQEDFRSILRFCMERWRIEIKEGEDRQQILKFMR
jgi:hypothetical protein